MSDIKKKLASKFRKMDRFSNFGSCLNSVVINGFRGLSCPVDFEFPVTAITGLNGTGKSTVGQLLLCGYKKLSGTEYRRFYVKDFFPVSVADPSPFTLDASIEFTYHSEKPSLQQTLTVSRAKKEWGGYKRQPEKVSIYIGLAFYLPKVERRDLTIYSAKNIRLTEREEVEYAAAIASRILGNSYDEVFFRVLRLRHVKRRWGWQVDLAHSTPKTTWGSEKVELFARFDCWKNAPKNH